MHPALVQLHPSRGLRSASEAIGAAAFCTVARDGTQRPRAYDQTADHSAPDIPSNFELVCAVPRFPHLPRPFDDLFDQQHFGADTATEFERYLSHLCAQELVRVLARQESYSPSHH